MIQIQKLSKKNILHDVNLDIKEGEFVLLQGESGSGKSTLLNIIASLTQATSGALFIDGKNISQLSDLYAAKLRRDTIAYITQNFYLLESLTLEENLYPPLLAKALSTQETKDAINATLKKANIAHKAKQRVSTLSGGERQRAIIARAIINNQKIILCDEPTANLDEKNSLELINLLSQLHKEGKTILVASHDPLFNGLECITQKVTLKGGTLE